VAGWFVARLVTARPTGMVNGKASVTELSGDQLLPSGPA
jgi:hypothetical protein